MTIPSLEQIAAHAEALDGRFLALALVFQLANLALRALAWRNVLAAAYRGRDVPVVSVGAAYAAGVALNAVTPARGGEAAKILLVRTRIRDSSVATIASSSSVILMLDAAIGTTLVAVAWSLGALPAPPVPSVPAGALLVLVPLVAAAVLIGIRFAPRLRAVGRQVRQGGAILRSPGRYAREVAAVQVAAWTCRIAVVFFLLAAFGLPATLPTAALVVVAGGLSTAVPTPGGMGTQQALVVYALHGTVSAAGAFSFSVAMQLLVTAVNATIGIAAMMLLVRTVRPVAAVRAGMSVVRGRPG
ncbi:MAG TPA: lysylphosphatidylglycerol synthase domain-containing protein [Gaiellaceae bacterium]|nr:lysylphosphatidylglycerol synthase domain-containing protein [Gaiellaceae bacterium]